MCEYVGHGHLEQNWLQRNLFEKRVHNAWLFKALCYTMCMHTSYNIPTEPRHVWFCWSSKAKLIAKPNMYKFFIVFKKKNFQKVDLLPPVYFKILRYTFN